MPSVFFVTAIVWISVRAGYVLNDRLAPALEGRDIWVEGVVGEIPQQTAFGRRFTFEVVSVQPDIGNATVPRRLLLSQFHPRFFPGLGERWRLKVRLKRPHGFQNPGGFDYEAYLLQKRIRARGYVREGQHIAADGGPAFLADTRRTIDAQFRSILGGNPHTGIFTALAIGARNGISQEQWEVFRATGTSHLIAISGLHIGLIAGFGFFILRWLWSLPGYTVLRFPAPKAGALGGLVLATVYAALAGFSIPTQRALVMLVVALGALLVSRKVRPAALLAITLVAVLLLDPLAPLSPGFWLSFLAVVVIVFFGQPGTGPGKRFARLFRIQWVLVLAMLPATLFLFQSASLIAPLANLFAVPLFGVVVVPLTMFAAFSSLMLPTAITATLLHLLASVLDGLWQVLNWLAHTVPSVSHALSLPATLVAAIGVLILMLPRALPSRWLGLLALLPLVFPPSKNDLKDGEFDLTLLDVGQGLSVVVQTRHHTLVYDTGPKFSPQFDTGRAVVAPYLRHEQVSAIDTLLISHGDNDHIGGAHSLRKELAVTRVLSSVPARLPTAESCYQGQQWYWDRVQFQVISPPRVGTPEGNNGSCVLHISSRYGSALLPGDIEREQEQWLIAEYGNRLAATVLVVPHHGSRTSSSPGFVKTVSPAVALFPVGYRNRYHHPNPGVVDRYRIVGSRVLATSIAGAISVSARDQGLLRVRQYRQQHRRFWFHQREG